MECTICKKKSVFNSVKSILKDLFWYFSVSVDFFIDYFGLDSDQRAFRKHIRNKKHNQFRREQKDSEIVLIESLQIASNNIALTLFLNSYSALNDIQLRAYRMIKVRKFTKLKAHIRHHFSMLRALGAKKLVICGYFPDQSICSKDSYSDIGSLEELEDFQINGIHIGDLVYDLYLTRMRKPTVDLKSPEFWEIFNECIEYFKFWSQYFEENRVKAICISHCVYNFAIPARIAISLGIEVFQVQSESIHRLDKENVHAYLNSEKLKKEIDLVSKDKLKKGLYIAKSRISKRFNGEYVEELELSSGIAFHKNKESLVRSAVQEKKPKLLVATHDFFDAVHFFGKGFYPDFYTWLRALSQISNSVDYMWYVKIHPDAQGRMTEIIHEIAESSNQWQVLPQNISHHDVFQLGIDLVLTVHGTIATEYPYFNIPVMNATTRNPHFAFDFSLTPDSRQNYEHVIRNLPRGEELLKSKGVLEYQSAIDEYFFGRHILSLKSWIYEDYGNYLKDLGGWRKSMTKNVYQYFLSGRNQIPDAERSEALERFIQSKDNRLERRHFNYDSVVNQYLNQI